MQEPSQCAFDAQEQKINSPNTTGVSNPEGSNLLPGGWSQHYYQAVPYLNAMQEAVRERTGPCALELIEQLDQLVGNSRFDPLGARYAGQTADDFFRGDPQFVQLEAQLAKRLDVSTVSDIYLMIKQARYYTPTSRLIRVLATLFNRIMTQS